MPTYFIHLENALKRANEFIEVQNKHRALEILCDVLHSKKHRQWQKKHEEIMIKYLELCVELKQSYVAKEGIYQYKIICQQSYISSFEDVIRKYIQMAEDKANQAKEESQTNISDIDDLENAQTPEDILMSAVSNEDNQDRKDRVVLIPWVKFLWESYRQCLDLLRHNNKTERLYHDIAHKAFKFCIKYNRKSEFRKLCDHLHLHLNQLKHQNQTPQQQQNSINLNSPESQVMQLETRLIQLDYAIQLELWQEAYKATDDIKKFNLMNLTKKGFGKPNLIATYYQKLSLVFWKAHSNLFHAAALFRFFLLYKDLRKNLSSEDIQKMASRLVLATLSIPIPPIRPEIDKLVDTEENIIEQHHRNLSLLLGITTKPPTRASLILDLKRMGVLSCASQPIQELFQLLEVEFNPLGICGKVQQIIEYVERSSDPTSATEALELPQYIPALKEVTVVRLIREVAQVYRSIDFSRLLELCPFVDSIYLEKIIVESARRHDLQVRIDHRRRCYVFGTELRVSTGDEFVEGPFLQTMPNEQMRRQLVSMYSSLHKALNLIEPDTIRAQREDLKRQVMQTYYIHAKEEHSRILNRQNIIEKRKELIEQMGLRREMDERKREEEEKAKLREAEMQRLHEETIERERLKRERDEFELRKQITMDQLKRMKDVIPDLELENLDDEELAKLRPQDLQMKRVEQLEKERREQMAKQKKLERKIDHFERAKRVEELELLKQQYEEWRVTDREIWDRCEDLRIEAVKEERKLALKERERFIRVLEDKEEFNRRVSETRQSEYLQKQKEFDQMVEEERKKRLAKRREKRMEERRVAYLKEKEQKLKEEQQEMMRLAMLRASEELRANIAAAAASTVPAPAAGSALGGSGTAPSRVRPKDPDTESSWRRRSPEPERARPAPQPFVRRDPPPTSASAADEDSNWRRAGPPKTADREPEPVNRGAYGGRMSEGRNRERGGGDNDQAGSYDRRERPLYGGSDSYSSSRDRFGPPRERVSRDRYSGRSSYNSRADANDSWRTPRDRNEDRPSYGGRGSDHREPPPPSQADDDNDGGWRKVDNGKRGPSDRRGPPPNRYGGRDSRDRRDMPPRNNMGGNR